MRENFEKGKKRNERMPDFLRETKEKIEKNLPLVDLPEGGDLEEILKNNKCEVFDETQGLNFDLNHATDGFGNHGHDLCLMKVTMPDGSVRIFVVKNSKKEAYLKESRALKTLNQEKYQEKGIRSVQYAGSASLESPDDFLVFTELEPNTKSLKAMIRDSISAKKFHPQALLSALGEWVALLHNNNICHGDLRAQNILFSNDPYTERSDFNISKNFVIVDCEKTEIHSERISESQKTKEIIHLINDLLGMGIARDFLKNDFLRDYSNALEGKIHAEILQKSIE